MQTGQNLAISATLEMHALTTWKYRHYWSAWKGAGKITMGITVSLRPSITAKKQILRPEIALLAVFLFGFCGLERATADVRVRRIDGPPLHGQTMVLTEDELRLTAGEGSSPTIISRKELIEIRMEHPLKSETGGNVLEFANGDRLPATVLEVRDGQLHARVFGETIQVPLGRLRGIVWDRSAMSATDRRLLFREQGVKDVALLTNGDRLAGRFAGASQRELTMLLDDRKVAIPTERLAMLAFSPELISKPKAPEAYQLIVGRFGWVTVTKLTGSNDTEFVGQTLFGETITFAPDDIQRIQFFSPGVISLTAVETSAVVMTPWLAHAWPVRRNRSPIDRPLALGNRVYARGLGVHSKTRITYPLGGEYDRFSVTVGLAESAGVRGNVSLAIEVDGKVMAQRGDVTLSDGAIAFHDISLTGAKSLSLIVDFGANGNIRDRVNWCAPILIRNSNSQE